MKGLSRIYKLASRERVRLATQIQGLSADGRLPKQNFRVWLYSLITLHVQYTGYGTLGHLLFGVTHYYNIVIVNAIFY